GATIHDVAQVVGAGYSISSEVGDYAVLSKMLRVAFLLPVVLVMSVVIRHRFGRHDVERGNDPLLPPFLLAFIAFVVGGSLGWIPKPAGAALNALSPACLGGALA